MGRGGAAVTELPAAETAAAPTVVVTGSFSIHRKTMIALLTAAGFTLRAHMTAKNVDYLVAGQDMIDENGVEVQRAKEKGVPILTESSLQTLLQEMGALTGPIAAVQPKSTLPPEWNELVDFLPKRRDQFVVLRDLRAYELGAPFNPGDAPQIASTLTLCKLSRASLTITTGNGSAAG